MINCFVLKDKLNNLYITPFIKDKTIGSKDSEEPITWFVSEKLNEDKRDEARLSCYKEVDESVDLWIQEKRYIPRLLFSAVTFLVIYFFLSLVVRDPIPMFDEIIGSFVASIFMWFFVSKKDKQSAITNKKKLEIKREVSNAPFVVIESLSSIEQYLDNLRSLDIIDLSDRLALVDNEFLEEFVANDDSYIFEFRKLIEKKLFIENPKMKFYYEKVIECRKENRSNEGLSSLLIKQSREARIDLPMLALLVCLKEYKKKVKAFIN